MCSMGLYDRSERGGRRSQDEISTIHWLSLMSIPLVRLEFLVDIRTCVSHKSIAIGHVYFRQRVLIQTICLSHDVVEIEQICSDRIGLVIREGARVRIV